MEFCCICAKAPSLSPPQTQERPLPGDRRVSCCARVICGKCIQSNQRFAHYCPYCQVSTTPSPLPQRLRDPPSYTSVSSTRAMTATSVPPPPYTSIAITKPGEAEDEMVATAVNQEKSVAENTLHFLDHDRDTVTSLSLRYGVPTFALRRTNNITSDHLLFGRRTILIPGEYHRSGVSLSPRPVDGEEEELRKGKIRRFMTCCKSNYELALLYLEQSGNDLGAAIESYLDDDTWERNHPRQKAGNEGMTIREHKSRGPFWRGL